MTTTANIEATITEIINGPNADPEAIAGIAKLVFRPIAQSDDHARQLADTFMELSVAAPAAAIAMLEAAKAQS